MEADDFWGWDILEVLGTAAMDFIDDLTLCSPRSLHLSTGLPAWRIFLIYEEAMEMIVDFHIQMQPMIDDIEGVRGSGRGMW